MLSTRPAGAAYIAHPQTTETDPTGRSPHEPGAKLDAGKVRPSLVLGSFAPALWEVARVGTYGATKYTDNGWKSVPNAKSRYMDAAWRHLLKAGSGEDTDPDTGIHHLAHATWNLLAVLTLMQQEGQV